MNMIVAEILRSAASNSPEVRREASMQLAMLLEKHSTRLDSGANYELILPSHLHSVELSESDKKEIVAQLNRLINSDSMIPDMLWALGKADDGGALEALLRFVKQRCNELESDVLWQALVAVDRLLGLASDGPLDSQMKKAVTDQDFLTCLTVMAETEDADNKKLARGILSRLTGASSQRDT